MNKFLVDLEKSTSVNTPSVSELAGPMDNLNLNRPSEEGKQFDLNRQPGETAYQQGPDYSVAQPNSHDLTRYDQTRETPNYFVGLQI
jgi:hypothetical protein